MIKSTHCPSCQREIIFEFQQDLNQFRYVCLCGMYMYYKSKTGNSILEVLSYFELPHYALVNEIDGGKERFIIQEEMIEYEFEPIFEKSSNEDLSLWTKEYFDAKMKVIRLFS